MRLRDLLTEADRDKAALDFLSNLVKSGPFKNRVFLAGGAPRDMQLGTDPKDLDVVVKGGITAGMDFAVWAAKEIGNYKEGSNPVVFPTYGTAKFTLQGVTHMGHDLSDVDVEAVAPRKEKYTPGSRKPEVSAGEMEDDVKRRDFTVNSLLHDLTTGETLDLTGMGKQDIQNGLVRTPLDPDIIFGEDPLRMLRAARFTAKYNWKLPMFMIRSIKKNASQLTTISKERIHDETNKMLLTNYPFKAFRLMQLLGLMKYVFPSLVNSDLAQMKLSTKLKPDLNLRLISAMVDVPPSRVQSEMSSLRYSSDKIREVVMVVTALPDFKKNSSDLSDEVLRTYHDKLPDYFYTLLDYAAVYLPEVNVQQIRSRYDEVGSEMEQNPLPFGGKDLIDMGIKPGPNYKKILDIVKKLYLQNPRTPKDIYLSAVKQQL
jgi:tRNA nucleotidyltransferase/poly(A) polymerase